MTISDSGILGGFNFISAFLENPKQQKLTLLNCEIKKWSISKQGDDVLAFFPLLCTLFMFDWESQYYLVTGKYSFYLNIFK